MYEAAVTIYREQGDRRGEGIATGNLADLYQKLGDPGTALTLFERALAASRLAQNKSMVGLILSNIGLLHLAAGRSHEARIACEEALGLHRSLGSLRSLAIGLGVLGDLCLSEGLFGAAREHLEEAVQAAASARILDVEGAFRGSLAMVALREGKADEADRQIAQAEARLRQADNPYELAKVLCRRWRVQRAAGQEEAAGQALEEAESLAALNRIGTATEVGQLIERCRRTR